MIAIANLEDSQKQLQRWWINKYKIPLKKFEDQTYEELYVEMLEDYYSENPQEIERAKFIDDGWKGETTAEHEASLKPWLDKHRVDVSEFQSDGETSEEEEKKILDSIGRNLPGSKKQLEFDETF